MVVVSYGGGTNSTALLIKLVQDGEKVDLILFADTGGESPETYAYIAMFSKWLQERGYPAIKTLYYTNKDGERQTLESELLRAETLPSPCYGWKRCSQKYKGGVIEKCCNNHDPFKSTWKHCEKVIKVIGYDAGERRRKDGAEIYTNTDKKYTYRYPLIDEWDWGRSECVKAIQDAGLPLPGKSSCFFCPNMKKKEIVALHKNHPDLFARAVEIERRGRHNSETIKGLGRNYNWEEFIKYTQQPVFKDQVGMCFLYEDESDDNMPCGCYDG